MDDSTPAQNKNWSDIQSLWQETTTSDTIKLRNEKMLHDIKQEITKAGWYLPSGKLSIIGLFLLMAARGAAKALKGVEIGDDSKMWFGILSMAFALLMLLREVAIHIPIIIPHQNIQVTYFQKLLAKITYEIRFRKYISPIASAIIVTACFVSLWYDFQLWLLVAYIICGIIFIAYEKSNRDTIQKTLEPLQQKIESALQQLSEPSR